MKKYIIMISSLSNMGGAQMYIRNKLLYLREHGWETTIIAGRAENIVIPELREFKDTVPELEYRSYLFSKRVQTEALNKLKSIVKDKEYKRIVVESTSIEVSTWAEILAKETSARHFIFLLQEHNYVKNKGLRNFYVFKHKRRELASITDKSLVSMFSEFYPINSRESYVLPAYSTNVEADVDCDILEKIDKSKYDFIVGAFSRLDKPFALHAVDDFCKYARTHLDKRFFFLWIGDAPAGSSEIEKIKEMVCQLTNVDLLITGYLLPVPTRLFEICDVFMSSSGSCWPCKRSGVPTISYDGNDFKPIGVLGWTTTNSLFRGENEPPLNLSDLLDEVLVIKRFPRQDPSYNSDLPDFKEHMEFLEKMAPSHSYYEIQKLHLETSSDFKVAIGLRVLGPRGYFKLHNLRLNR